MAGMRLVTLRKAGEDRDGGALVLLHEGDGIGSDVLLSAEHIV
jgi:hypothetical protein